MTTYYASQAPPTEPLTEPECICCYYAPASDRSREVIDPWPIVVGIKRLIDKERESNGKV